MTVFAFLDLQHPPVAWAVMRGTMVSAKFCHQSSDGYVSFMLAGMIEHQNNTRLLNESLIEGVRLREFPSQKSRLRGMYFFRTRAEAEARIGDPEWPEYFTAENLLELLLSSEGPATIVDANWITFAPRYNDGRIDLSGLEWIQKYWRAEQYPRAEPAWEMIAEGVAVIPDIAVRRRCTELVERTFPDSHISALMARLGAEVGTRGGLIAPFISRHSDSELKLAYLWSDAEFHDGEVIQRIAQHQDSGRLGRLIRENERWKSPDFSPWTRVFKLGATALSGELVASVHQSVPAGAAGEHPES